MIPPNDSPAAAPDAGLGQRLRAVAGRLACPQCRAAIPLRMRGGVLGCDSCGAMFPIRNGIPMLLRDTSLAMRNAEIGSETGRAMVAEYSAGESVIQRRDGWASRFKPPGLMYHPNPDLSAPHTARLFDHAGPDTMVLNVGGGPHRYRPGDIALNLDAFRNVDVVGDAHAIPFLDDSFDSVFSVAVLEHVRQPWTVAAEQMRVLRPGGWLYAEAPFIFFFHGYPNDFTRFTREGLRQLFDGLEDVQLGLTNGPVSATLQTVNTLLQFLVPQRMPWLLKAVRGAYGWGAFPLKYLDRHVARREDAHMLAGGLWIMGRKPGGPR